MLTTESIQSKYSSLSPSEKQNFERQVAYEIVDANYGDRISDFSLDPTPKQGSIASGDFSTPRWGGETLIIDYKIKANGVVLTPRNLEVIDHSESQYYTAIALAFSFAEKIKYTPLELYNFAKTPQCHKGWVCGGSCLSKTKKNCHQNLNPEHKTYAGWLKNQYDKGKGKELHQGHRDEAEKLGLHKKVDPEPKAIDKPKAEPKVKANKKPMSQPKTETKVEPKAMPKTEPISEQKTQAKEDPRVHSIKTEGEFEDLALHAYSKLQKEHHDLVPIFKLRRAIGELVPRDKFDNYMKELERKNIFTFIGGSVSNNNESEDRGDSLQTSSSGLRTNAKLNLTKEQVAEKLKGKEVKLDKILSNPPPLDNLGTARELTKGKLIKNDAEFNKDLNSAYQKLNTEFKLWDMVPIHKLKETLGDRISNSDFEKYVKSLIEHDKYQWASLNNPSDAEEKGGIKNMMGDTKHYLKKIG